MVTGEDSYASGADGSFRLVTGEDPYASGADASYRMVTGEDPSRTRARIEVFSAVMEEQVDINSKPYGYQDYFGVIFLCSCNQDFVIFDAEALQLPQINSEDHVTLSGPRHSIPVQDNIDMFVWFFDRALCKMHRTQTRLWEESDYMDGVICRSFKCFYGNFLNVSFAVYHDAVEAHLNVYFLDFDYEGEDALIQVHGKVTASNSFLTDSKAKSILFHKLSKECVVLKPGKLVPLPLSRRVVAVPCQSSLLVHVSIDVGIAPDNLLVIEEIVKFNPSLGSTERSIILPNRGRGKVLLMVSWVDCQTLDGHDHLIKEGDVASQVANFIDVHAGEGDPGSQRSNVMDCFRDFKVPRVEYQTDVHTRFPLVEASQSVIVDQQQLPVSRYIEMPRTLMEVFSVKFLEFNRHDFDQMYGCILMSLNPPYVVFSRKQGGPLSITPEGFVKLRGPNRAIEVYDAVYFVPHLFKYETCSDQFKDYDEKVSWGDEVIWDDIRWVVYDTLLSKSIQSRFGPIEVDFAVYEDGVEARAEVSLTGCQFASAVVYGCITAENSKLGERARSFLFNRDKTEGIRLYVSPYKDNSMKLPLSRSTTVHPIGSDVTISVNIWQRSIMGSQDQPIAKNVTCKFTYSRTQDMRTFRGVACLVNVGVVWSKTSEPINMEFPFI